jgi:hypothetical protein
MTRFACLPTPNPRSSPLHGEHLHLSLSSCPLIVLSHRVDPREYTEFDLNPDVEFANTVGAMLSDGGFKVTLEPDFEQVHDTL